jgi:hypothetical protein
MKRIITTKGYTTESVCRYTGISRQAFYKRLHKSEARSELYNELEEVVISNRQHKSRSGLRAIYHKEEMSSLLGINQFEKEMSSRGYALQAYKSYIKTTDSRGKHYLFDNLIEGIEINKESQVIVGDITYYQNISGLYYIFQFTDVYTMEIKGIIGSKNMEGVNAEKCLRQMFKYNNQTSYDNKLIIHTDGGGQYRSHKYQRMLRKAKILPSQAKSCFENGLAERVNGIVKNEYLIDYEIRNVKHLNTVLKRIQKESNEIWPSKTLGYKTPKQYAELTREMNDKDRPKKTIKIVH